MTDCIFCKIASQEVPTKLLYTTNEVVAFPDLHPRAPTHVLIIPKKHIATLNEVTEQDASLYGQMFLAAKHLATTFGFAESGYRLVHNVNAGAGQSVFHIHLHLMGGRVFNWPPG